MENYIYEKQNYRCEDDDINNEVIQRRENNLKHFLEILVNTVDIEQVLSKIQPETEYAVKFTPALLKKMEEHDVEFLKDKITGELLPIMYDYTDKQMAGQIRLEMREKVSAASRMRFNETVSIMLEQDRFDCLMEELQELKSAVGRVERGQDRDRIAKVFGARDTLHEALVFQNDEESKKALILNTITNLNEGRRQFEEQLIEQLDGLKSLPETKFKRIWHCFKSGFSGTDVLAKERERYSKILECFKYYYLAIEPLAFVYTFLNQPYSMEIVLENTKRVLCHENLARLVELEEFIGEKTGKNIWYKQPELIADRLLESYEESVQQDLLICFKGSKLINIYKEVA